MYNMHFNFDEEILQLNGNKEFWTFESENRAKRICCEFYSQHFPPSLKGRKFCKGKFSEDDGFAVFISNII